MPASQRMQPDLSSILPSLLIICPSLSCLYQTEASRMPNSFWHLLCDETWLCPEGTKTFRFGINQTFHKDAFFPPLGPAAGLAAGPGHLPGEELCSSRTRWPLGTTWAGHWSDDVSDTPIPPSHITPRSTSPNRSDFRSAFYQIVEVRY